MIAPKSMARIVGLLFIVGTVSGILSGSFLAPYLTIPADGAAYQSLVATNEPQFVTGVLLILLMGFSLAFIPIVLYPLLRRYSESLAMGYVVFRGGLEFVAYLALVGILLTVLAVSTGPGPRGESAIQSLRVLLGGYDVVYGVLLTIVFAVGALLLYDVLYRSRLIPRWLSGWGLVAAVLWLAWGLIVLVGLSNTAATVQLGAAVPVETLFALPIALQELVMAVWLLVRGFEESSIVGGATGVAPAAAAPDVGS